MSSPHHARRTPSVAIVVALVAGWAIIGFGVRSAWRDAPDAHPLALLVHVVAFDLAHDLVAAPLLCFGGWVVARLLPPAARGPVRAALVASVVLGLFSTPLVRRWGERPTNPSALPQDYGRNLAVLLVMVWATAIIVTIARWRRNRSGPAGPEPARA